LLAVSVTDDVNIVVVVAVVVFPVDVVVVAELTHRNDNSITDMNC